MRKIIIIFTSIIGLVLLFSWTQKNGYEKLLNGLYKNTVPIIHPHEVTDTMVFLDAREWREYEVSHLRKAHWIGYNKFRKKELKNISKNKHLVVYCTVGYRSERIGEKLNKMGYDHVSNLYGGIFEWKNKGNTVVDMNNNPTDSVHVYDHSWGIWLDKGYKVYE